jgi:hypothetical protein
MRAHRVAAAAASLLAFTPWSATTAHAVPPRVDATFTTSLNHRVGGNWFVTVGCKAVTTVAGQAGGMWQAGLATKVTCTVNDTSRTVTAVGTAAATQVALVAPLGPVYACVSGEAAVIDVEGGSNALYHVTAGPNCIRLPNT